MKNWILQYAEEDTDSDEEEEDIKVVNPVSFASQMP